MKDDNILKDETTLEALIIGSIELNISTITQSPNKDYKGTFNKVMEDLADKIREISPPNTTKNTVKEKLYTVLFKNYEAIFKDLMAVEGFAQGAAYQITLGAQSNAKPLYGGMATLSPTLEYAKINEDFMLTDASATQVTDILPGELRKSATHTLTTEMLGTLHRCGVDLTPVLQSAMENPTEQNFGLFKYMVDSLKLNIKKLDSTTRHFDPQHAPLSTEGSSQMLRYIQSKLTIAEQSSSNEGKFSLLALAFFFDDKDLFKELLQNLSIDINPKVNRSTLFRSVLAGPPDFPRLEVTKMYLESDRFKEIKELPRGTLAQSVTSISQEGPEKLRLFQLLLDKTKDLKGYKEDVINATTTIPFMDNMLNLHIAMYNSVKIDAKEIFKKALVFLKGNNTATNMKPTRLLFFMEPSLLDEIGARNPSEKLMYILEGALMFKDLDFKLYANEQHTTILGELNNMKDYQIRKLATHLLKQMPEPSKEGVDEYIANLKIISNGHPVCDKLGEYMHNTKENIITYIFRKLYEFVVPNAKELGLKPVNLSYYLTAQKLEDLAQKYEATTQERAVGEKFTQQLASETNKSQETLLYK